MENTTQTTSPASESVSPKRRRSLLSGMSRLAAGIYAAVQGSLLGRGLTGYRQLNGCLSGSLSGGRDRTVSRGRLAVAKAVQNSRVMAFFGGIFAMLYDLPLRFYGLFGLLCGACGLLNALLLPWILPARAPEEIYAVVSALSLLVSLPLMASGSSLRSSLSRSRIGRFIFGNCLCIPLDTIPRTRKRMPFLLGLLAVVLGVGTSVGLLYVHPLTLPVVLVAVAVSGMILARPETGVLLLTALLPVLWFFPDILPWMMGLIVLTWVSYGLKVLQLHRIVRVDVLSVAGIVLLGVILIAGVCGVAMGEGSGVLALQLFACLSVYALLVRLMITREYINRCLRGMGATLILVLLSGWLLHADENALAWMGGSRGGDLIVDLFTGATSLSAGIDGVLRSILMVMSIPLLLTFLLRFERWIARFSAIALLLLDGYLLLSSGSTGAMACALLVVIGYFLLLDHRSLVVGTLLLPVAVGGIGWYWTWRGPVSREAIEALSVSRRMRGVRYDAAWSRISEHPFGEGFTTLPTGINLYMEVLVVAGWPGLIAGGIFLFLLLQKSLSALTPAVTLPDRARILGLMGGVAAFLLRGVTQGFLYDARAMLTLTLFCAMLSAFCDRLFEETDVREAEAMRSPERDDRIYTA